MLSTLMNRQRMHRNLDVVSPRAALLLLVVVLAFGVTRYLMLQYPDGRNSTAIWIFSSYGFEAAAASARGASVYDVRARIVRDSLHGTTASQPGAGRIEYPPLAISSLALPVRFLPGARDTTGRVSSIQRRQYAGLFRTALAMLDVLCLGTMALVLRRWLGASTARLAGGLASYVLSSSLLFLPIYDRLDLIVGALLLSALAMLFSSWPVVFSLFGLAVAISLKLVAVLAAPVWIIGSLPISVFRKSWRHQLLACAARTALLTLLVVVLWLPYWLRDGWRSLAFLQYHAARGIQIESLAANALFVARLLGWHGTVIRQYGSADVVGRGTPVIALLGTLAMLCMLAAAAWRMRREVVGAAAEIEGDPRVAHVGPALCTRYCVLLLLIGLCGAKVFSPQYLLWLLPIAPLVLLDDRRADVTSQEVLFLVCFTTLLVFPLLYREVRPLSVLPGGGLRFYPPTAIGLVVLTARSVCLLWLTWLLWGHRASSSALRRGAPSASRSPQIAHN